MAGKIGEVRFIRFVSLVVLVGGVSQTQVIDLKLREREIAYIRKIVFGSVGVTRPQAIKIDNDEDLSTMSVIENDVARESPDLLVMSINDHQFDIPDPGFKTARNLLYMFGHTTGGAGIFEVTVFYQKQKVSELEYSDLFMINR